MLDTITGMLGAVFSGGITGLLGVVVQRVCDYKNKQLDLQASRERMAHEVEMRKADAAIMAQEWSARTQIAEVEAAGQMDVAASQAFAASFKDGPIYSASVKPSKIQAWLLIFLDFVRGLVRPALVLYLSVLTTIIYFHARKIMEAIPMSADDAAELVRVIVQTILYLFVTATLHYFGTRNKQPSPKLGR